MPGQTRTTPTKSPADSKAAPASKPATPPPTAETPPVKRAYAERRPFTLDVQIEGVSVVKDENPFARGSYVIPDDHPLVEVFDKSAEHDVALNVKTPDPASVVKILQRIAAQKKQGVRIDKETRAHLSKDGGPYNGVVTFKATKKRAYKPRTPAGPADSKE